MPLLNCYYYAPHNHCLLARHLDHDLRHMAAIGTAVVSVCVQESQLANWHHQRLRNVVDRTHAHGLKVHAVPNRWCGLTAGWLDGLSPWTLENPDALWPGREQRGIGDPRHPKTEAHFRDALRAMLERFDFDGVVWDEPRPPEPLVIEFLDRMSAFAKSLRPGLVVSLFAEAGNLDLAPALAATRHVDYLGADGHVRSEHHAMHRMKNTIFTTHARFRPLLAEAGKRTVFLLEAQRHRDADLDDYLANVDRAFTLPMDQLIFYYSAHEMSPPCAARLNEATWNAVAAAAATAG